MIRFLVALWAAGFAAGVADATQLQPVRIGLVRQASAGPLYIAVAAEHFQAEGLDPQVKFLESEASVHAAVASGELDIGLSALSPGFYRYAAAHGFKMIASQASDQSGFPMVALLIGRKAREAGLSDIRGLPGARIGIVETEEAAYYGLSSIGPRFGLRADPIKVVWFKSSGGELAALSHGDIDAALLPFATAMRSSGKGDALLRLSDFTVWQQAVVFTAARNTTARRGLVERFMRAYQRGTADYQLNFLHYDDAGDFIPGPHYDAYLNLIARQAQVSAGLLATTKTYCDRRANLDVADIGKQVKFWQDRGRLDRGIAAADLVDLSFIGEELTAAQSHPTLTAATGESPAAVTADGGRYYGPLIDGMRQGQGRIEWDNGSVYEGGFENGLLSGHGRLRSANGDVYEGQFKDGLFDGQGKEVGPIVQYEGQFRLGTFWGQGELRYDDGRKYRGAFVRGRFEGQGRYEDPSGDVYEGSFEKSEFTGYGVFTRPHGARHEGQFRDWKPEGPGTLSDGRGTTYAGEFLDGQLTGIGRITGRNGSRYEGEINGWMPDGQGELRLANGDVYKGQFKYGQYDGEGTLTYAKAQPDGRTQDSGTWQFGRLKKTDEEERQHARAIVETALYSQPALLARTLGQLAPRDPKAINLYLLAIAGAGSQEVFRREVDFVRTQFDTDFGTRGHSVALVNSRNTVDTAPMATLTSIRQSLAAIATAMDKERDILFLYITSHGSADHEISLGLSGMELPGLSARELGAALKESAIRWKVVVISACYAGGFIDEVRDPYTLVLTAARRDRRSFGCADENDFTYFGRAYFKEALPKSTSFQDAFSKAEKLIGEWEDKDARDGPAAETGETQQESGRHSLPQMDNPPAISDYLQGWWAQRAASAKAATAALPIPD